MKPLLEEVVLGHVAFLVQVRYRGPVALLKDEEVVVLENLVDELIEQRHPDLRRGCRQGNGAHRIASDLVQLEVERHQDVLLAGEVVVDGSLREPQPVGYLTDGCCVVTLRYEQVQRYLEDPLSRVALPRRAGLPRVLTVFVTRVLRHLLGRSSRFT